MTLSFDTDFGTFRIKSATEGRVIYRLSIISEKGEEVLGRFCSMNDAILAVVRQESGLPEWDELCLSKVPYRVFDITCWDFFDFSGTNAIQACS